jgi:starch-binding outer membrane protein, SusD/RagB family
MKEMKKYSLIFISILMVGLFSCEDKLDLAPISDLTTGNYYQTEAHIEAAVTGMYSNMRGLFTVDKPYMAQSPGDNTSQLYLSYNEGETGITQYKTTTENFVVLDYWQEAFQSIYRCNIVIEKSEEVEFANPAAKEQYIGEAKFLRGLIYFDMVRFFGGVPLVTEILPLEETYLVGRASPAEIWAQVKTDLTEAAVALPETDSKGRATKYSALGILADMHLNLGEHSEAKVAIDQVINSKNYEFFDDFADVYKDGNNNGKHSIFAIQFLNQTGEGNSYPTRHVPKFISTDQWPFAGTGRDLTPSENLWNAFSDGDLRRDLTLKNSWIDGRDGFLNEDSYWQCKHGINNTPYAFQVWGINHIVMRYAEALLISAEVENKLGSGAKAVTIINQIRNRAGLEDFSSSDQNEIHDEIYLQRRLELAFENERWFDIQRSGKAAQILAPFTAEASYPYSETYALFPIPQIEIGKVGSDILIQNPGY